MADFPPGSLLLKEDSKHRTEKFSDPAIRHETEGGYEMSRPRYTRPPRRTFTTGFTQITDVEKQLLDDFYRAHNGGSGSFTWDDRVTNETHVVRFAGAWTVKYVGAGGNHLWDISDVTLKQV